MTTDQTTPDHIGDANKMVSTMPERIWAAKLCRDGKCIAQNYQNDFCSTEYIRADVHTSALAKAETNANMYEGCQAQLNQSLLAQSVLREALTRLPWPCPVCNYASSHGPHCFVGKALATTTPPTDRIVVTREMVEKLSCECNSNSSIYDGEYNEIGTAPFVCPRCELLAQFPSEQPTKEKGE